jgi:hypothetical protein
MYGIEKSILRSTYVIELGHRYIYKEEICKNMLMRKKRLKRVGIVEKYCGIV